MENTWYDWSVNYISKPNKETEGGVKGKIMSRFKANTTKDYSKPTSIKNLYDGGKKPTKLKMLEQSEDSIIKNIRNLFRFQIKKENEAIKDRIIRDIKNIFGMEEEDYYKPVRVDNFYSNNYVEYESSGDSKKPYQSNNPLINLTIFKRYHK